MKKRRLLLDKEILMTSATLAPGAGIERSCVDSFMARVSSPHRLRCHARTCELLQK